MLEAASLIKQAVEKLNQEEPHNNQVFTRSLESAQVEAFEQRYFVRLPEEYRAFITSVGERLYDENDVQFDLLLPLESYDGYKFNPVSCRAYWRSTYANSQEIRRWHELTGHEKIESFPALLIHVAPSDDYFFLLLSGPDYGEVWHCSEGESQASPMLSKSNEPMRFLEWMFYLLQINR